MLSLGHAALTGGTARNVADDITSETQVRRGPRDFQEMFANELKHARRHRVARWVGVLGALPRVGDQRGDRLSHSRTRFAWRQGFHFYGGTPLDGPQNRRILKFACERE